MSSPAQQLETTPARSVSLYMCVANASAAIDFYCEAFGAKELMRLTEPDRKIGHAEMKIGNSMMMISDEYPEFNVVSPKVIGNSPVTLHLYVNDVDDVAERAMEAGALIIRPVEEQFYGERSGRLVDPFGHIWIISTRIEDLTPEQMQKRYDELAGE